MSTESEGLIKDNNKLWREIRKFNKEIYKREQLIKSNNSEIFKICEHKWEYDMNCGQYDRIRYQCKKCRLWKCRSMYT